MNILVTGAAGFVGSTLCERLLERGDSVVGLDNFNDYYSPEQKRANVKQLLDHDRFSLVDGDFCDEALVDSALKDAGIEAVAHIGAMANVRHSVKNPLTFVRNNVHGTTVLLEQAVAHEVKHFVFASTGSVYGQRSDVPFFETDRTDAPLAPYPASKKACELMGHAFHNMFGITFSSLRFFNVYGPKGRPDMMPWKVLERLVSGEEIVLFDNGQMHRDWTYVADLVRGIIAAIDTPSGSEIFNLGRGEPVLMTDFMTYAQEIVGKTANVKVVPAPESEPKMTYASIAKAQGQLSYQPSVSLKEGLEHFWQWYQGPGRVSS